MAPSHTGIVTLFELSRRISRRLARGGEGDAGLQGELAGLAGVAVADGKASDPGRLDDDIEAARTGVRYLAPVWLGAQIADGVSVSALATVSPVTCRRG